ncbi:MAG: sigma-70 family RNA polymerase sigma factor [Chloroflexi bacterium]|nr:sigma-70 family RNA polymerase sigma factor [Chloroflexota bacterium]
MTDADLIARARRRDEAAWEALAGEHQEAVFRLAYLILGDPADADDVAQEAFIRAYGALDRFDTSRALRPWLLSIAANLARNRLRSAGRYFAALTRFARGVETAAHDEAAQDESSLLWQAVRRLSQTDQEIIYLRYFLEMSESETSEAMQVAAGTVKSRAHRALGRLRDVIAKDFPNLRESVE